MKMSGEEIIAAPRQVVWDALNDPEVLKQCITGCEEIKKKSDTEMEAKVTAKVGPVKASFVGAVKLSKLNPPRSYVISGEGKGGMAGFAKGGATVQLSDTADGQTKLSYDVDAQVGGKLAQIGSRLIDSTAKKMAADFFKKFNKVVSDRAQTAAVEEASKPAAKKATAKKAASKTAAASSAAKPAAKKASKKAATKASSAGTAAKKAAKKTASKATKTAAAASTSAKASVKSAKTTAKTATKAAKSATKSATKTASKAAKKASKKAASAANTAVSTAEGAAADARQASVQTAATAANAVETAAASANAGADKVANTMPPQAKSMSTMWMLVMAAAAIGLLLIWASGKG